MGSNAAALDAKKENDAYGRREQCVDTTYAAHDHFIQVRIMRCIHLVSLTR